VPRFQPAMVGQSAFVAASNCPHGYILERLCRVSQYESQWTNSRRGHSFRALAGTRPINGDAGRSVRCATAD